MTPGKLHQKLTEWEALDKAATPGPWRLDGMGMFVFGPDMEMIVSESAEEKVILRGAGRGLPMEANAAFIAAARTALPEAIKEIRRLRTFVDIHDRLSAVERLQTENAELRDALTESVKLQSHYAKLLNMHDGGERIGFKDAEEWIARLQTLSKQA